MELLQDTYSDKFCKDLFGLWLTSPDCSEDQYISAFSFDTQILKNMIEMCVDETEKNYFSIKPVKFYQYLSISPPYVLTDSLFLEKNVSGIIIPNDNLKFGEVKDNIYGYYRIKNGQCEQVLLCTKIINNFMESNGISCNPIQIDKFYEESILNA